MSQQKEYILKQYPDYFQTLINCMSASKAIYEDDPKESLKSSKLNHSIRKVAVSLNREQLKKEYYYVKCMVCECSNKNQLVVAFRETGAMNDFLLNLELNQQINHCDGYCHSSVFFQSAQIPLEYFIDKILNENYEIVFTGHSFGASIAALVAVRLLLDKRLREMKDKQRKVLFIGFGSPLFVDDVFKKSINEVHGLKDNFHFYLNEDDFILKLLDAMMNIAYTDPRCLPKIRDIATKFQRFMDDILDFKNFEIKDLKLINEILMGLKNVDKQNYCLFGKMFNINRMFHEIVFDENSWKNFVKQFKMPVESSKKSHFIESYLNGMKKYYLNDTGGMNNEENNPVNLFTDICLPPNIYESADENGFSVKFIHNELQSNLLIKIRCKNNEFINGAILKGFGEDIEVSNISFQNHPKTAVLAFSISNTIFYEKYSPDIIFSDYERRIKEKAIQCIILAKFNSIEIDFNTIDKPCSRGFSNKRENIECLNLDILYIYSIFYYKIFHNSPHKRFSDRCEKLLIIYKEIDKIWNLKDKSHQYNQKKKKQKLQARLINYFNDCDDKTLGNFLDFNFNFNEKFVSLEDCVNMDFNELIRNAATFYEIMKLQMGKSLETNYVSSYLNIDKMIFLASFTYSLLFFPLTLLLYLFALGFSYKQELMSYIYSIDNISLKKIKEPIFDFAGCYETVISEAVEAKRLTVDENDKKLQTILLNRQIRDILIEDFLFGVCGKSNCGKSTFVQKMTGLNTNASANITTTILSPYKITESVMFLV